MTTRIGIKIDDTLVKKVNKLNEIKKDIEERILVDIQKVLDTHEDKHTCYLDMYLDLFNEEDGIRMPLAILELVVINSYGNVIRKEFWDTINLSKIDENTDITCLDINKLAAKTIKMKSDIPVGRWDIINLLNDRIGKYLEYRGLSSCDDISGYMHSIDERDSNIKDANELYYTDERLDSVKSFCEGIKEMEENCERIINMYEPLLGSDLREKLDDEPIDLKEETKPIEEDEVLLKSVWNLFDKFDLYYKGQWLGAYENGIEIYSKLPITDEELWLNHRVKSVDIDGSDIDIHIVDRGEINE